MVPLAWHTLPHRPHKDMSGWLGAVTPFFTRTREPTANLGKGCFPVDTALTSVLHISTLRISHLGTSRLRRTKLIH